MLFSYEHVFTLHIYIFNYLFTRGEDLFKCGKGHCPGMLNVDFWFSHNIGQCFFAVRFYVAQRTYLKLRITTD